MATSTRYALYYMPAAATPLWQFGCRVLGYDAAAPAIAPPPPFETLTALAPPAAFAEPATYGFHATLKAPFELAESASEAALLDAANGFAARQRCFGIGRLQVARLHHFIALVPTGRTDALHAFADSCVRDFDGFRAPLSAADRARRLATPRSPAEIAHLDRWGYPYVFESFQFHMTLSGLLRPDSIGPMHQALAALYAPIDAELMIDGFAVFKQVARSERFQVLQRFSFAP